MENLFIDNIFVQTLVKSASLGKQFACHEDVSQWIPKSFTPTRDLMCQTLQHPEKVAAIVPVVEDFIRNVDKGGEVNVQGPGASMRTFEKTSTGGHAGYAQYGVAEARASYSNVGARISALTARVEYELRNFHLYVGANLVLAQAEVSAGPMKAKAGISADTFAHVGLKGVGVNVLGFGFRLGPTLEVNTMFGSLAVDIFKVQ